MVLFLTDIVILITLILIAAENGNFHTQSLDCSMVYNTALTDSVEINTVFE